ncbi:MAG TPA: sensor domain-containing diguanylate cyclase [Kofleriaceae bacterium]|nr:sensor domain-containing diguanylate cyclase [Kofleriaceae bacterium]
MARWFTIALGIGGWTALAIPRLLGIDGAYASAEWTAIFFVVILASRTLPFHPVKGSAISLDSAFYVAAVLCIGPIMAGRLTAVALTADAAARFFGRFGRFGRFGPGARRERGEAGPWLDDLGYVLYFGGMSGGLLVGCGLAFGAGPIASGALDPISVAGRVVGIGAVFLASHYTIQGIRLWLLGRGLRAYLREQAGPGIVAEASLLPLGIVLVLLYEPGRPLGFLLLALTYLLIDLVFSRLSRTRRQLEARVHELEILNATARRLSASLQLTELVDAVARETCNAIPEAEAVVLVHRRAGDNGFVLDGFDRATEKFVRHELAGSEGAAGWVMSRGLPRRIDDLALADDVAVANPEGIRAWLGVPLFYYGTCEGVIAVQSARRAAFRPDHQRLLESLALQIAAALQNAQLYELAMVDGLTGLFVRRYFDARIEEEIERSRRDATPFSVVMMDVDDFKKLNDDHGHLIGDRVLQTIATTVKSQMRGVDTAARYGGEEIALILSRTEMVSAYSVGERIRAAIADQRVTTDSDPPKVLGITASFGIASYPESGAERGEDLVRQADRALYRAKKTGKNRVELFWSDEARPAAPPVAPESRRRSTPP